jgi:acrylyl-CoA reductase (NADPH)
LLVRVQYSSLNYKDGLSCIGNPGVTRRFPHTPGIDAAGIVQQSYVSEFKAGDSVVVAGTALGMDVSGGFGQFIRIPSSWAVPLPKGMSLRESMIYGTAGFTAALAIHQIRKIIINPVEGSLVVTGATGGVGSVSVSILSKLGHKVTAITGKPEAKEFLKTIGACDILSREDLNGNANQSLLKEAWAGGIDTVGGPMLAALLKSCKQFGTVAATGLVASSTLPITLLPFILRGVNLLGINAQGLDMKARIDLWSMLAGEWRPEQLETIATECVLEQLNSKVDKILAGHTTGRVVVDMR